MQITDEMIERAAREYCRMKGLNPDWPIYYEQLRTLKALRHPVRLELLGRTRRDGSVVEQYPTVPSWKWRGETIAERLLRAAVGERADA